MYLSEEYNQRHALELPFARFPRRAVCFVMDNEWQVMFADWVQQPRRVACYLVQFCTPKRDYKVWHKLKVEDYSVYNWQDCPEELQQDIINKRLPTFLHMDQWEDYLFRLTSTIKKKNTPLNKKEVFLAGWQIFLKYLDVGIQKAGLIDAFFPTIDVAKSINYRYDATLKVLAELEEKKTEEFVVWKTHFLPNIIEYTPWISDLISSRGIN